ncbi:hypothetical protein PNK_p0047 (plasmid) [Candidatus Protochlamydia naegleriophila]|uniref:Uncharacterized protein n=1 Tax=Candidatus Protochlamydia naegleriophila TaxID=389348 RepID=A0A0U5JJC7_9BACT|nr:hypothetical protein [Candidatus Protochlamydia naegleriophila]CUI18101.1 hypothetical protein PNK_p0047 [Candidatus Protochlamydia naegleriophila]
MAVVTPPPAYAQIGFNDIAFWTRSEELAKKTLLEKIQETPYQEYEINELLNLNIPYFYQIPGKKHLYNGNGQEYSNVFSETAVEIIESQFLSRSKKKKEFDLEIISRHLPLNTA